MDAPLLRDKPAELAKPFVLTYPAYEPGRPIEDVARDLGLDPAGIIKLASNENPFGPSPKAAEAAKPRDRGGAALPRRGLLRPARGARAGRTGSRPASS